MAAKKNQNQNLKISPEHEQSFKELKEQKHESNLARFKIDKFRDIWFLVLFIVNFLASFGLMIFLIHDFDRLSSFNIIPRFFCEYLSWCLLVGSGIFLLVLMALLLKPTLVKYLLFILPMISLTGIAIAFYTSPIDFFWAFGIVYTCLVIVVGLLALLFSSNTRLSEPFYISISKIFRSHLSSLLFLLVCFILTFAYMLLWGIVFYWNFARFGYTAFWYLLLSVYWVMESMRYFIHSVIAGMVARHYLQSEEEKSNQNVVFTAAKVALTYTAGSTTIGALLLTPVTVTRQLLWFFGFINDEIYTGRCGAAFGGLINKISRTFHPYTLSWLSIYGDERSYVQAAHEVHDRVINTAKLERVQRKAFPDRSIFMVIAIVGLVCAGITIYYLEGQKDSDSIYCIFSGLIAGIVLTGVVMEALRGAIYSTIVCYAEDQNAVQVADPDISDHIDRVATRQEFIPQSPSAVALNKDMEAAENV